MISQRGGFAMGLVAGLLIGLALALGVALYITKAPNPFVNKVPQRTAEQDSAETERNRNWDPNAPLAGKPVAKAATAASGAGAGGRRERGLPRRPRLPPARTAAGTAPPSPSPRAKDPAAILSGGARPASAAAAATTPPAPPAPLAPRVDAFVYFVQAGAFTRSDEAEQQRARLGLLGLAAKITEREQAGRTVYRVRVGPFSQRDEADKLQARLQEQTIEAQIVRVEKP